MALQIYQNRIQRIFNRPLDKKRQADALYDSVLGWLMCEWLLNKLDSVDYFYLRDEIAREEYQKAIKNLI